MNAAAFPIWLALGAALLALWLHVRYPRLGGDWRAVLAHLVLAFVAVQAVMYPALDVAVAQGSAGAVIGAAVGIALPAFTYVFLSAIWLLRVAQGLLGGSYR